LNRNNNNNNGGGGDNDDNASAEGSGTAEGDGIAEGAVGGGVIHNSRGRAMMHHPNNIEVPLFHSYLSLSYLDLGLNHQVKTVPITIKHPHENQMYRTLMYLPNT